VGRSTLQALTGDVPQIVSIESSVSL